MRSLRTLAFVPLVLLASTVLAQTVDPALTAAIAGRDKAAIDRDPVAMAKYTADDYAAIPPNGARTTKPQRIAQLKAPAAAGSAPPTPLRTEAIHLYGTNAAVARLKQVGNRQLAVWIKNPSGWQAVAIHVVPDAFMPVQPPQDRPKAAEPSATISPAGLTGEAAAIFAAHKELQDAYFTGNREGHIKTTAPEYVRLNPGLIRFGGETGGQIDGQPRHQPTFSNVTVQVWGQVGVVRWLETGRTGTGQWLTRVFTKTGKGWQQVAMAGSAAANPPIQSTQ